MANCTACVVRVHCLELSLRYWSVGQQSVWGGTVPAERAALRRELAWAKPGYVGDAAIGDRAAVNHVRARLLILTVSGSGSRCPSSAWSVPAVPALRTASARTFRPEIQSNRGRNP
jgi:hypothetical protein